VIVLYVGSFDQLVFIEKMSCLLTVYTLLSMRLDPPRYIAPGCCFRGRIILCNDVLNNPPDRPSVCRSREREVKPPRRRGQLTKRPKAPPQDIVQRLAPKPKGGNEYYIDSSFCFIEIKTLNHRKCNSTSHIKSIVREINN
jgi:hypothetical protein